MKKNIKQLVKRIKKPKNFQVLSIHIPRFIESNNRTVLVIDKTSIRFSFPFGIDFENEFVKYEKGILTAKLCGGALRVDSESNLFTFCVQIKDLDQHFVDSLEIK
jgi:hypothetical protein